MERMNNGEMEIDLLELFYALKKRVLIILAAGLLTGVLSFGYTKLLVTPMYTSTTTMLVLTKETTLSSLADLQMGSQLTGDYRILITSHAVLDKVIENLKLDMSYGALKGSISINNPTDTRIMEVSVTNSDPAAAKEIVDEVAGVASQMIGDKMEVVPPKVIDKGDLPTRPTGPNTMRNVVLGVLAGLVLSAGIFAVITIMDDTIKSEEDIAYYLNLSTLATVPDRKDYVTGKKRRGKKKDKVK